MMEQNFYENQHGFNCHMSKIMEKHAKPVFKTKEAIQLQKNLIDIVDSDKHPREFLSRELTGLYEKDFKSKGKETDDRQYLYFMPEDAKARISQRLKSPRQVIRN